MIFSFPKLVRFLLLFFLFGCIPVLLGFSFIQDLISLKEDYGKREAFEKLDRFLFSMLSEIDPLSITQKYFRWFCRSLNLKPFSENRIFTLFKANSQKWKIDFEPYVFDEAGKLVTPSRIPLTNRFIIQKVWNIIASSPFQLPDDITRNQKKISLLFGEDFNLGTVKGREGLSTPIRFKNEDGVFFWSRKSGKGFSGQILICWKVPTRNLLLEKFSKKFRGGKWLIGSYEAGEELNSFGRVPSEEETNFFTQLIFGSERNLWRGQRILSKISAGPFIYFAGREAQELDLSGIRGMAGTLSGTFLGILFIFLFAWVILEKDLFISIRTKFLFLFIFAIIVPLMGIGYLGLSTMDDHRKFLISESIRESKDLLLSLDAQFQSDIQNFRKTCLEFRNSFGISKNNDFLARKASRLIEQNRMIHVEIRNLKGEIILSRYLKGYFESLSSFFEMMGKMAIMKHLEKRLESAGAQVINPPDQVSQEIFESPEMGFPQILAKRDEVRLIQFGKTQVYWYWDIFEESGHPAAFIGATKSVFNSIQDFLEKRLGRFRKRKTQKIQFLAYHSDSNRWFPQGIQKTQKMKLFMEKVQLTNQVIFDRFYIGNSWYYGIGIPGKNLLDFTLMALFSEKKIDAKISRIGTGIRHGIAIIFLIVFLTVAILSEAFLGPVKEISKGMEALQKRETHFRVTSFPNDELGLLAQTFNRMIEDLGEIQVARVVQESLLPKSVSAPKGYEIALKSRTASELGGDYYDVIQLRDQKFLILIGDATGHGISAALCMTLVKAGVFQFVQDGGDLRDLMKRLNRLLFTALNRKKLMTFFASILDPVSGGFDFIDSGHNFPVFRGADGEVSDLEMDNLPLGASMKAVKYEISGRVLQHGDFIVLYSDGLVEATNSKGEMFGYSRLHEIIRSCKNFTASEILDAIWDSSQKHSEGRIPEDDVTIFILRRLHEL